MALPKQVEKTIKDLEALEAQLAKEQEDKSPSTEEPKAEEQSTEPTPVAEEPKATEQPKVEPSNPVEVDPQEEETWQQKYRTLQGMYDAEVPRLHAQLKELKAQMKELEKPKAEEAPKPKERKKLVTDDDVQAFGEDLIEVQRKVAREVAQEFQEELEKLRSDNDVLREQLTKTGSQVSEASFEQRLHRMVPDFDQVNADPKWIAWLNEVDPLIRAPRMTVAQEAFNRGDAEGVAYYVSMFKQGIAPAPQPKGPNEELERQIQPNRSATNTAPVQPKGKTYSVKQIEAMFKKAADLGGRGDIEAARKLEAEIDAAYMENRVTA